MTCLICGLAPCVAGFDGCYACVTAYAIHEDPESLDFFFRHYGHTPDGVAMQAEMQRQLGAVGSAPFIRLSIRQAS